MNPQFIDGWFDGEMHFEYAVWLGQPNLYDMGLFVNRTVEEHTESYGYGIVRLIK